MTNESLLPPTSTWPFPGAIVSVPFLLFFRHRGIVSDRWRDGKPMVISNSPHFGGVTEEPWEVFAGVQAPLVEATPARRAGHEIVRRAKEKIGTRYHLLNWNCDSLVAFAYGEEPRSAQVEMLVVLGILALAIRR